MRPDIRKSGISLIGDLPWGSHFCQFYQRQEELLEILLPYLEEGLRNNEYCVWVAGDRSGEEEAWKILKKSAETYGAREGAERMEMIHRARWRALEEDSGSAVVTMLDRAITSGFDGLRLAVSAFPGCDERKNFAEECMADVQRNNALVLFAYPRDEFDTPDLMEAMEKHKFALLRNAGSWEVLASTGARFSRDELKRSEEKLRSLFNNMSEGFAHHRIVLDREGKPCDYVFLEVNSAFERLTGLSAKNIIGKRVTAVIPGIEKDRNDWIGKYGKVAVSGEPAQFESYAEPLDRWYSVSAFSPHRGFFAVLFSDITERKKAEVALRQSSEYLDRAQAVGQIGWWRLDTRKNVLSWSDETHRIFGVPKGTPMTYEKFLDAVHPDDRAYVEASWSGGLAGGSYDIEHRIIVYGRVKWVREKAYLDFDETGELIGGFGIAQDITEHMRLIEEIRRSENLFAAIVENIPVMLVVWDGSRQRFRLNRHVEEVLGWTTSDANDGDFMEKLHPDAAARERIAEYLAAPAPGWREWTVTAKNGRAVPCNWAFLTLPENLRIGIGIDLRAQKLSDEALRRKAEELARSNRDLEQFAYAASHDLQEPLRAVAGFMGLLKKGYRDKLDENAFEFIELAIEGAERMQEMVNGLLTFSRVGTKGGVFGPVDMDEAADTAIGNLRMAIEESKAVITRDRLPAITADSTQMKQLYQNLIGNAIKFRGRRRPHIHIWCRREEGQWVFGVRDKGIGIEPQYYDRIFTLFQRLHTREEYKGSGIGLALCKRIVERHNGALHVKSVHGKGSDFYFSIPDPGENN